MGGGLSPEESALKGLPQGTDGGDMKFRWMFVILVTFTWVGCDGGGGKGGGEDTAPPKDTMVGEDTKTPADTVPVDTVPTDTPVHEDVLVHEDTLPEDSGAAVDVWWPDGVTEGPMALCSPGVFLGGLRLDRDEYTGEFFLKGPVLDQPYMADKIKESVGTEEGCTLWKGLNQNFCEEYCLTGEECWEDGLCHPAPKKISIGTVTLDGLKEPFSVSPNEDNKYPAYFGKGLPYLVGAPIEMGASGGVFEAFSLSGAGIEPMEIGDTEWVVEPDKPFTVTWEPSEGPGMIYLELNVDQHGTTPVTLECVLEDTGTYTISAGFITEFIESGAGGAARGEIWRKTVDSIDIGPGCIQFEISSLMTVHPKCKNCPCTTPPFCPE